MAGVGDRKGLDRLPPLVLQVADARAKCLSNPDLGSGSRGAVVVQLAPHRQAGEIAGVVANAVQPRRKLVLENAALRYKSTCCDAAACA